ncbi:hypothetical protein JOF29_006132 [Kribbella aluminosa]|uniref:Uncharacterized protein n=1 Tax=Kribbella aluminosa TaxID=416017 RepID=A0ABS4UTR2_9ACTN|nr:hypothetical protein [Kribbella aluminosa]MBP2355022.1 hypothetical protein [Kribbella aluminosa]
MLKPHGTSHGLLCSGSGQSSRAIGSWWARASALVAKPLILIS